VVDETAAYNDQPEYDLNDWKDYIPEDIPLQDNGTDCGVFMCQFVDYLNDRLDLTFSVLDLSYFRRHVLVDLPRDLLANNAD
jgi:sentrin-specific protease 1